MATQIVDARGLKCPQPTLKITAMAVRMKPGDVLEALADCPTFEKDVRDFCTRSKRILLWIKDDNGAKRCQIQF
jgi:tRNA 2-thiouridine synthesizing protein A